MGSKEGKYNIKAISIMLGIQPGTLRAWERRYRIVKPVRNQAGHRLYTDEHVATLRWLLSKVRNGFTIGQAVELLNRGEQHTTIEEEQYDYFTETKDELLIKLLSYNEQDATALLHEAYSVFGVEKVILELFRQMVFDLKVKRFKNEITFANEQFIYSFMQTSISSIYQSLPVNMGQEKIVVASLDDEDADLGLKVFALFFRRKGFHVIRGGMGLSLSDIENMLKEINANVLIVPCKEDTIERTLESVHALEQRFPRLIIGIGGYIMNNPNQGRLAGLKDYYVGETKQEWESWLQKRIDPNKGVKK